MILCDETTKIAEIEQLSLGARFVCHENGQIRKEFMEFVPMINMTQNVYLIFQIDNYLKQYKIDLRNMVGQGYDGCSVMAGKENGVQKRIRTVERDFITLWPNKTW